MLCVQTMLDGHMDPQMDAAQINVPLHLLQSIGDNKSIDSICPLPFIIVFFGERSV